MCPALHQQPAPLGAHSFPSRALTTELIFTMVFLLLPWAHLCILMSGEAQAKLQEKDESEKAAGASCCGFLGPLCLRSVSCHQCNWAALLRCHCSFLWHWEHCRARAESLFRLNVQSPRLTRSRWWWQRLRSTPSHPTHGGWLPCASGFNLAHQTTSKRPSWCAHCSAESNRVGHQQCKPLTGFPSPCFLLQLLWYKKSKLQGHLSLPGHSRSGSGCPLPFPSCSLMAAMNQQPVDLSKAFLHFNPIDRDYCLQQELRGEPCQQQILITDNIDGAFSWIMKGRALCFDVCLQNLELLRV